MGWVLQTKDTNIPDWLMSSLDPYCSCGAEKENFYNNAGECTSRRCSNKKCPETMASKIADMCTLMGIQGVKDGKGLRLVREHKLGSHFEALPLLLSEKPTMYLSDYMRICFIPGVDTAWHSLCGNASTIEDLMQKVPEKYKLLIEQSIDEIKAGLNYVVIKGREQQNNKPLLTGNVMISGNIRGFNVREDFIKGVHAFTKGLAQFNVVGKRKTNVLCLIQEADEPRRGKAACALENGIPIMTPAEFMEFTVKKLSEIWESTKKGGQNDFM